MRVFCSLLLPLHVVASPSPFNVLLPLFAPLWLVVLSTTLLWTTTFSSLASFYTIYASTKCCFSALSSYDFSMHFGSINVARGPIYSLACQCCLLLCKNSITDVSIMSQLWIIVYTNCISSLYAFPSTHFKDDDECDNELIVNGWIFNTPFCVILNSSSTYFLFNNSTSSSNLCLCSLLCTSFSLTVHCSFSIALSTLYVPCITTWKHLTSSLYMNVADFIFQLLHIHNLPTLSILIPLHFPRTPLRTHLVTILISLLTMPTIMMIVRILLII